METARGSWRYLLAAVLVLVVVVSLTPEATADLPKTLGDAQTMPVASPEDFSTAGAFVKMLGAFLFCLGLFAAGIHLYRKYGGVTARPGARRMAVLERLAVTHKSAVYLVSLDGKEFLLTSGPDNLRIVSAPTSSSATFDESLAAACQDVEVGNA
jgi:flagellar biogenesis protein FliO